MSELVLEVVDLARAERFYGDVLGLRVIARPDDDRVWLIVGDRTRLGLWRPQVGIANGRGGVHVHFAIAVTDSDYDAICERLTTAEFQTHEELLPGGRALYVTDPDGNVVEVNTRHGSGALGG